MPITDTIDVTINVNDASVAQQGFDVAAFVTITETTNQRVNGPYTSPKEVLEDYAVTTEAYKWAAKCFAQSPAIGKVVIIEKDSGDADLTATLTAAEAAETEAQDWYVLNTETNVDADVLLGAAWIETRTKLYIPQTTSSALLAGTGGNIGLLLNTANYNRTGLIYHDSASEYLDAAWTSRCLAMDMDVPGNPRSWAKKELQDIDFAALTSAQVANIKTAKANFYGRFKGLSYTDPGTAASGRLLHIQRAIDWLKARTEEAFVALIVGAPDSIPLSDAGILLAVNELAGVFARGQAFGHLSRDVAPVITAPTFAEISAADKAAGLLTLTAEVTLANSVAKVSLTVNAKF